MRFKPENKFVSWLKDGRIKQLDNGQYFIGVNPLVTHLSRNAISASNATREAFEALDIKNTPVLLLRAETYSCVSDEGLQLMKEIHPSMKYVYIPNFDHSIHKTATNVFLENLEGFIKELA